MVESLKQETRPRSVMTIVRSKRRHARILEATRRLLEPPKPNLNAKPVFTIVRTKRRHNRIMRATKELIAKLESCQPTD
jgi:hypothetical protein